MQYTVLAWIFCASLTICFSQESDSDKNGYIFTSPRALNTGSSNELHLRRFGNLEAGTLNVQVYYNEYSSSNNTTITEKQFEIPAGAKDSFLQLYVNKLDSYVYNGKIAIDGSFGDYKISGTDNIIFASPKTKIVLIQTDKPFYKPGQDVKFRVLKVEKNLMLSGKDDEKADVYVEDPKGTRLFQFKDIDLSSGLIQREFPLSEEPVMGNWKITIKMKDSSETESATFEVKEYVLPKFDVTIKFPSYVLMNAEVIPVEICAKYTYGKPVVGTLNLNASLEKYTYSREKIPTLQETIKIEGCYNYTVNVSLIQPGSSFRYRRVMLVANVVEDGTGVDRNKTEYLHRQYSPLSLVFGEDQRQFFKPGLPYNGKIQVKNPDDTPAADEPVEFCATITKERVLAEWWATKKLKSCKNYTSDKNGEIKYTVPSQNTDVISISLEAKSIKYSKEEGGLNVPAISMTLNPYFSPSGSFIQLQPINEPVPCGTKQSFKLLFTSKEDAQFKFYYQVMRQSDVIQTSTVETAFSTENDVSSKYKNVESMLDGEVNQLFPPPQSIASNAEESCPPSKDIKYLPLIGEIDLDIEIDATLSPTFYILVYYVRDDRETVADSQKVEVEKCFKNKVDFSFGDKIQQPGLKTSIQIAASPNSLCGIKIVDKSVSLMNDNDQLTKEHIFEKIDSMDTNHYYIDNPCNTQNPQPGLYQSTSKKIPRPPPGVSSSSYDDSLTAFQSSGFVVMSDLILFTRPCISGVGYGSSSPGFQAEAIAMEIAGAAPQMSAPRRPAAASFLAEAKVGASSTKSVSEVRTFFPETWLFEMEMTGSDGTYLAKEKLPDTITEWIGSAVCINAKDGLGISNSNSITAFQAFFLDYTLPVSVIRGEEFTVTVSVFSYADGALPLTITLINPEGFEVSGESINGDICVEPDTSKNLKFKIKATTIGKINITVKAETSESSDVCGSSSVAESRARDAVTKSVDVLPEGFPDEKVFNSLFCPSDAENGMFEHAMSLTLPEDAIPDSSRAYIDFTGNVMGKAIENLDRLVTLPTGCGEQNMVKFTPNYLVLDYLKDIGMLTDDIEKKAKRNLNKGYQRELTYRHTDGSFSAFGNVDKEGSMFLTAFVLRSFYEAKRHITIDNNVIEKMQEWIVSKQRADGCFPDIGKIVDIGLQGGIEKEKSLGSITAYVLASLLISKYDNTSVTDAAFTCLKNNPPTSPYGSLLYAYAEALAEKVEAKARMEELQGSINKTDDVKYFTIPKSSESVGIEAAAYGVLVLLKTGGSASEALPFVRYLTSHLNPRGGFKSTQDTCVGLTALSKFASLVYKDPVELKITSTGGFEKTVEIIEDNKLLVQRFKVTTVPGDIKIEAKGAGCGLVQTSLRYNTASAPEKRTFFLDVSGECTDENCLKIKLNVVVSYLPSGMKAGMSIVEIKLITGIAADKESLDQLLANKANNILRYDIESNNVILYFSELTNAGHVFSFQLEKIIDVENSKHGTAKVYDYYAPENSASTKYWIKGVNSPDL